MPDTLSLTPIGVGFAYARPGEVQSCYLVTGDDVSVCLDLGAGAFNRLQDHVDPERLDAIVISHHHSDHCADLLALRVYLMIGPGRGHRVRLIAPAGLRERLVAFGGADGWDEGFAFELLEPESVVDVAPGWTLSCVEVPHAPPTFALRVDRGGVSITYGADCAPNEALPTLARGTDLLLTECSEGAGPRAGAYPHLDARDAAAMAVAAGARRLLLTHCAPEHDRDAALRVARDGFGGPVDWARQGETVVVSAV